MVTAARSAAAPASAGAATATTADAVTDRPFRLRPPQPLLRRLRFGRLLSGRRLTMLRRKGALESARSRLED